MTKSWKKLAGTQLCPRDVMQLLPTEVPTELTPLELLPLLIAKKKQVSRCLGEIRGQCWGDEPAGPGGTSFPVPARQSLTFLPCSCHIFLNPAYLLFILFNSFQH